MHAIVERIYSTKTVTDGCETYSALNAQGLPTYVDTEAGALLQRVIDRIQPKTTLEIGMAYGVSTMFICEALSQLAHPASHIVIDPLQYGKWRGIGFQNVRRAGYERLIRLIEDRSEFALPCLLATGPRVDVALIDGFHTFEQCALELYYLDRLLNVGGVLVFDDADWRSVNHVVRLALSYGTYRVYDTTTPVQRRRSLLGYARRLAKHVPYSDRIVRIDVLERDWDLGIAASCIALQKTSDETRSNTFWREF